MAAIKALQQWCRVQCDGYRDVAVSNMTTSFRDGLAFCAIIHKHRPDLINFDSLKKENVYENNNLAFKVAEEQLGIPALLDAEDMVALKVPDRLSILTYVSQYYNYFHGRSPIGGVAAVKRPAEPIPAGPSGKENAPVVSKVFKPSKENHPPPTFNITAPSPNPRQPRTTTQGFSGSKGHPTGTLSNKCASCNNHVHLVQRYLVAGKLYHRNCAKLLDPPKASSLLRDTPPSVLPPAGLLKIDTVTPVAPPRVVPPRVAPPRVAPSSPVRKRSPISGKSPSPQRAALKPSTPLADKPTAPVSKRPPPHDMTVTAPAPKPVAAPRASANAAKTIQSKLKFFQAESGDTKPATKTTSDSISTAFKSTPPTEELQGAQRLPGNVVENWSNTGEDKESQRKHGDGEVGHLGNGNIKAGKNQPKENLDESKAGTKKHGPFEVSGWKALLKTNKEESNTSKPTPKSDVSKKSDATLQVQSGKKEAAGGGKEVGWGKMEVGWGKKDAEGEKKEVRWGKMEEVGGKKEEVGGKKEVGGGKKEVGGGKKEVGGGKKEVGGGKKEVGGGKEAEGGKKEMEGGKKTAWGKKEAGGGKKEAGGGKKETEGGKKEAEGAKKETEGGKKETEGGKKTTGWGNKEAGEGKKEVEGGKKEAEGRKKKTGWGKKEAGEGKKEAGEGKKEVEGGKKEAESGRGRLRLKVNPSIFSDLKLPRLEPSPIRSRTPERGSTPVPSPNTSEKETPADWRSMLKPVSKESKSADPSQTSPQVRTNNNPGASHLVTEVLLRPVKPSSSQGPNGAKTTTTSADKVVKTRPDFIPKEVILKELTEIEDQLDQWEKRGVALEAKLRRSEDEGQDDSVMDELMVEWFTLIRNKQVAMRRESELVYVGKTQDLEEEQPSVEQELRKLMEKADYLKTPSERKREEELMSKLMEIVNDRNAIVEGLDEDRLREEEEDQQLDKLLENFSVKKDKSKKKSSMAKLLSWGNKKEA
ncbi:MICAL-like protein 2 [Stigmatopora argus]